MLVKRPRGCLIWGSMWTTFVLWISKNDRKCLQIWFSEHILAYKRLTLQVLELENQSVEPVRPTESIPWLLMFWLLASPSHQQTCYFVGSVDSCYPWGKISSTCSNLLSRNGRECKYWYYRKTSSISRTKSQKLNVSCILLQLSSLNPSKPGVKLRMKM